METREKLFLSGAIVALTATTYLYYTQKKKVSSRNTIVTPPQQKVSVIMCTYNEEGHVVKSLQSLHDQNVVQQYPEYFEFILVDSNSEDGTINITKPYVDSIITAPKGKLTSRDIGTLHATGDLIVAVDADRVYPVNWMNMIIEYFRDPTVIAVTGSTMYRNALKDYFGVWYWAALGNTRICGGASAYRKWAYFATGGFDLSVNQLYNPDILKEEEFDFAKRLKELGNLVYDRKIMNYSLDRRGTCLSNVSSEGSYCVAIRTGERF